MEEKRKFARFHTPIYLKYRMSDSSKEYAGIVKDISMGGLRVVVDKALDISLDNVLTLYLLIPDSTLKVSARVAWTKDFEDRKEVGASFVNIPDAYKENIYNYIFKYYRDEVSQKWWQM
jgi:c-di-GMP-binding flagellar brake protein YcgR